MTLTQLIALIGTLGVGSVLVGVLTRWNVISTLRQKWIDALRDDIAEFLKQINAMHYRIAWLDVAELAPEDLEKHQTARNAALLVYRRILLRLNSEETLRARLGEGLKGLFLADDPTFLNDRTDQVLTLARRVLKQEWRVCKFGMFARVINDSEDSVADRRSEQQ